MRRDSLISAWMAWAWAWCLLAGCTEPTVILVHIEGESADPVLFAPDDVDGLDVTVSAGGEVVTSRTFEMLGPSMPLAESITLLPGASAGGEIRVEANGWHEGVRVAAGTVDTAFSGGKTVEENIRLGWLDDACIDDDRDGYGKGPACLGPDCDDGDNEVVPGTVEVCNGRDDDCDGETDEDLDPPRCDLFRGVCREARKRCGGTQGWLACSTEEYGDRYEETETSLDDGFDNDCDGAIDEGGTCIQGTSMPCSGPTEGICDPGLQECEDTGSGWHWGETCEGEVLPRDEQCDGLDDDCDGQTDENYNLQMDPDNCGSCGNACGFDHGTAACQAGVCVLTGCDAGHHDINGQDADGCEYTCTPTVPPDEQCDGNDNDCNGATDDLAPRSCPFTGGVCADAADRCVDGGWTGCDYGSAYEADEQSCDGLDNDCDGQTDELEPLPCPLTAGVCSSGSGGERRCQDGNWTACDYGPDYEPEEVSCDGLDNDCDGTTDAADPQLEPVACERSQGVCAGVMHLRDQCGPGGWQACLPWQYGDDFEDDELSCDGLDNDCDGATDEDTDADCPPGRICLDGACACPPPAIDCYGSCIDTNLHPEHCGGCGQPCQAGELCDGGSCITGCPAGWAFLEDTYGSYCISPYQGLGNCCQARDACKSKGANSGLPLYLLTSLPEQTRDELQSLLPGFMHQHFHEENQECYITCYNDLEDYGGGSSFYDCTYEMCHDTIGHCPAGCAPGIDCYGSDGSCAGPACPVYYWCHYER